MVESGTPIEQVAQYLGHTNPAITYKAYARFSPQYLKKAAAALEF
jgi:integrase